MLLLLSGACASGLPEASAPSRSASSSQQPAPAGSSTLHAEFGLPVAVVESASKLGSNLQPLRGTSPEGDEVPLSGFTIEASAARARAIVESERSRLPEGIMVFVLDQRFGLNGQGDVVAFMRAADMFEVIQGVGTNGWNYDLGPDAIGARIRAWNDRFGLRLVGAGFDWFEAEFVRQPPDIHAFAAEVYELCPDVVDQGAGTVEALAEEMKRTHSLYLWWD